MTLPIAASTTVPEDADVVAVAVGTGRSVPSGTPVDVDVAFLEARGFEGALGECAALPADGRTVLAVGVGDPKQLDLDGLRRAAAAAVRASSKAQHLALALAAKLPGGVDQAAAGQAVAEGASLGAYRFSAYKSDDRASSLGQVTVVAKRGAASGVQRGARIGEAVALARDLVNTPPSDMTPVHLAEVAEGLARDGRLQVEVWDEDRVRSERLGGLLGVAAGSTQPPRLLKLVYEPEGADRRTPTLAFVGKGITFDSGGLSIKTADGMTTMKTDMSGAAAVLGAMSALPDLAPPVRVIGFAACTENMPGGSAMKPGDVLHIRNGKTVEVLNTDAEGRLVLADALSLAVEAKVDAIVDLATLTGACIVALGREIGGLMGNDEQLVQRVASASERAGEPMWHLPLPDRYRKHIESEVADIKNVGAAGQAGTLSAGLFLQEFVGDVPWVHLDIAGPARSESDEGYTTKGGTGVGVRTLLELATGWVQAPGG